MPTLKRMAVAALLLGSCQTPYAAVPGMTALLKQTEGIPEDFRAHFFDVPLLMRVERDGQFVGDASVLLTQGGTVQIIAFTDFRNSPITSDERQRWAKFFAQPRQLGECTTNCGLDLLTIHYDMQGSKLSLVTRMAERGDSTERFFTLPQNGSTGLILRNRLNLNSTGGQPASGRYDIDARGSLGLWTAVADYQLSQTTYQGTRTVTQRRRFTRSLYMQREYRRHYVRAGVFTPQHHGVSRQPRGRLGDTDTTIGVMLGSSDTLDNGSTMPSAYPVYVTANRQSVAEILRDGVLINTQPVATGLQTLDTRPLPGGIYEVEIRLIEDGRLASTQEALIHKPTNWRDPAQRWRYNVYAGQQRTVLDSRQARSHGETSSGFALNYLAHPRLILGGAAQQLGRWRSVTLSADWQALDTVSLSGGAFRSNRGTTGADVQALLRHASGSVLLNHRQTWNDDSPAGRHQRQAESRRDRRPDLWREPGTPNYFGRRATQFTRSTSITLNQRLSPAVDTTTRVTLDRSRNRSGTGADLTLRYRRPLFGHYATWRLSIFDRPTGGYYRTTRNRGAEIGLSMALSREGRRYNATMGTRSAADGKRDQYGSFEVTQDLDHEFFRSISATAMLDRYSVGGTGRTRFESQWARGTAFMQRSSNEGRVGGGANIESTIAAGGRSMAISGSSASRPDAGMIIHVDSDVDDLRLRARDTQGGSVRLRAGRNFVPVKPYRTGNVQIDFEGQRAPAARIHPNHVGYHLNTGGVAYSQISVTQTITVVGRLVDAAGQPVRGAFVLNDAGTSVSEGDGFFVLDMSQSRPSITVRQGSVERCTFKIDPKDFVRDGDGLLVGDLLCAGANPPVSDDVGDTRPSPKKGV